MLTQIENSKGIISYDSALSDQVINDALAKYKGQFKLIKKSSEMKPAGVCVYLTLHLKFGQSIAAFSNDVFSEISQAVVENLELPIDNIVLTISGIYSKKTVKKNIVIEYNAKS